MNKKVKINTVLSFGLSNKLKKEIEENAYNKRLSVSEFIRDLIKSYLKKKEPLHKPILKNKTSKREIKNK